MANLDDGLTDADCLAFYKAEVQRRFAEATQPTLFQRIAAAESERAERRSAIVPRGNAWGTQAVAYERSAKERT